MVDLKLNHFIGKPNRTQVKYLVELARSIKLNPLSLDYLGKGKTLGLVFMNPSLRTRLSLQKAAANLGMNCLVMNIGQDGWGLETSDGTVMDANSGEHIKEAAQVVGEYCDFVGIRSFSSLKNKEEDYSEKVLNTFVELTGRPVINMESATVHPLQSFADLLTIKSYELPKKPKVVLSWAPHIKQLPHAVANSFADWMSDEDFELVLTHPRGYELPEQFTNNFKIEYDQEAAFKDADFIYSKNWSSYTNYGQILPEDNSNWMIDKKKMDLTNDGKFMHCLPVRRNLVVTDEVIDSPNSIVIEQAGNRVFTAQAVLANLLQSINMN